ncbi:MAG: signal recognition particle-docking protein FtsY [Acidimicrobiales bacterium]
MEPIFVIVALVVIVTGGFLVVSARRGPRAGELEPPLPTEPRMPEPEPVPVPPAASLSAPPPEVGTPEPEVEPEREPEREPEVGPEPELEPEVAEKPKFRDRLSKARDLLSGYVGSVLSRTTIDNQVWDDIEEALIRADVGVGITTRILDDLRTKVGSDGLKTPGELVEALKADLKEMLRAGDRTLMIEPGVPNVWLFVGVNGVGKTTTIGKIGRQVVADGRTVVMAAGDTFRAAAADQLQLWADRVGAEIVRGAEGGDPASVIFDAVQSAAANSIDLVLADTAGRLHTKLNLMEELKKVRRVAEKDPGKVSEVLLVIDATTGQNGLVQAKQFTEAVQVTGIVLTKLDGTAKGGIALAIQGELGIPIKLVGLGEGPADLIEFDPDEFVEALFS